VCDAVSRPMRSLSWGAVILWDGDEKSDGRVLMLAPPHAFDMVVTCQISYYALHKTRMTIWRCCWSAPMSLLCLTCRGALYISRHIALFVITRHSSAFRMYSRTRGG